MARPGACALALLALIAECTGGGGAYYGAEIGALSSLQHGVRGRLYAVDSRTLYLRDFHYDGEGPAAYFYVGSGKNPAGGAGGGVRLRDERGGAGPLRRYAGEGLALALPEGRTLKDVAWLAVWCDDFSVNFGSVSVGRGLAAPRSARAGALRGVHGVASGAVVVVDAQTLLVPNFSYDGEAPDAKFWVGRGPTPSPQGIRIPDEHGSEAPLRKYDNKTIVLTLPGELTVFDIGHFGVWCEAFTVDFGHVALPPALLQRVPPSLRMLGVSPQSRNKALAPAAAAASSRAPPPRRKPARLDATTYRPPLRLRTGAAPGDGDPAPHTSLHRRADSYTPPKQQLLNQRSEDEKETQKIPEEKQETKVQKEAVTDLPIVRTQQAHNAQKTHQQQTTPQETHDPNQQNDPQHYYQQQQSQEIYQEHYQEPEYLQPQQHLYPYIPSAGFQDPFHQPQIFNQRAFELLNQRQYQPRPVLYHPQTAQYRQQPVQFHPQQFQPQPQQYRLVPYSYQ